MKKTLFNRQRIITIFILCCSFFSMYAQDPSAIIDLESTTQGMLAPRMTTAERGAIATPAQSLLVYDTDTESFWYYKGTEWTELGASTTPTGLVTYSGSASGAAPGNLTDSIANALPDVVSTITLSGAGTIEAGDGPVVCLNVSHTWVADLEITLTGPDGTTSVLLMNDNGESGDNLTNTCFSDAASTSISTAVVEDAPYTGTWKPLNPLSAFVGQSIAGDWVLTINDDFSTDHGRFLNWSIKIGNGEPTIANVIQDGDGDTKIQVEEKFDEDIIRYDLEGAQRLVMALAPGGALRMIPINENTILGNNSGEDLNNGYFNTFIGAYAGKNVVDGSHNVLVGNQAGLNYSGGSAVVIGPWAGRLASGSYNVFLGSYAGLSESNSHRLHIHSSGSYTGSPLIYGEFDNRKLFFHGDVGIGSASDNKDLATGYRLSVKGKIICEDLTTLPVGQWPDYVFEADYDLRSLAEVQAFIDEKGHLPGVPSAEEVAEKGIEVGQMNKILMEKVEELTLYILEQNEMIQTQKEMLEAQKETLEAQNARLEALENK